MTSPLRLETLLVHGAARAFEGALVTPIFQTSTFGAAPSPADLERYDAVRYTRLSNGPQHLVLHERLALVTGHERALTCASGMAAIATTLATHARGGRVFFQRGLYGGTQGLARDHLPALGVACDIADSDDVATWEPRPGTRVIFVEAISNPLLAVLDLPAVVALARKVGALAVIDATFASPINLRPAELGFDLEFHSATKYMNGHSDLIAGVVCGRAELVAAIQSTQNHLGACLDPHAAFLLERGLKTMALRVRAQNANAEALAELLARHPAVRSVHHPSLSPDRLPPAARPAFRGFGGVLSFDVGTAAHAERLMAGLQLASVAPSLGGTETLVTRPAATSHVGLPPDERRAMGIGDGLIRVACGIEHVDDLRADFTAALASL